MKLLLVIFFCSSLVWAQEDQVDEEYKITLKKIGRLHKLELKSPYMVTENRKDDIFNLIELSTFEVCETEGMLPEMKVQRLLPEVKKFSSVQRTFECQKQKAEVLSSYQQMVIDICKTEDKIQQLASVCEGVKSKAWALSAKGK